MNWSTGLSWLAAFKARREARAEEEDRADMGTAFGLDASLGPLDDTERAPLPPPTTLPTPPWEHRLTRRSSL